MKKEHSAPATKADIAGLMDSIGKLYDATESWKDEILGAQARWKDDIIQQFKVSVELIRHDLVGANSDRIELLKDRQTDHEQRITRLEGRAGISW